MASESLASKATQCSVYREVGTSDHAPVVAVFELDSEALAAGPTASPQKQPQAK
jgi:hypothetical protein